MAKDWKRLPHWMLTNKFFKKNLEENGPMEQASPESANLVSSVIYEVNGVKYHYPVIDLDLPAELIPSSTKGHSHLYIQKRLTHEQYGKLLAALREAGIIQQGIIDHQWEEDGMTCARIPGDEKTVNSLSSGSKMNSAMGLTFQNFPLPTTDAATQLSLLPEQNVTTINNTGGVITAAKVDQSAYDFPIAKASKLAPKFQQLAEIANNLGESLSQVVASYEKFLQVEDSWVTTDATKTPKVKDNEW